MDWFTFITKIADALAWPLVLAAVLFWLRKPIELLITGVKSARFKEFQVDFSQKLQELEVRVEKAQLPNPQAPRRLSSAGVLAAEAENETPDDWTFGDYIERLAPISPRAAIAEAWRHVEIAVKQSAHINRMLVTPRMGVIEIARSLAVCGLLAENAAAIVEDLGRLRDRAVHSTDDANIAPETALEFGRLAERAIASIGLAGLSRRGERGLPPVAQANPASQATADSAAPELPR